MELAVRGAAIVLHSLGEREERYRGAGEKEGERYMRKGEFDKRRRENESERRSGSGGGRQGRKALATPTRYGRGRGRFRENVRSEVGRKFDLTLFHFLLW